MESFGTWGDVLQASCLSRIFQKIFICYNSPLLEFRSGNLLFIIRYVPGILPVFIIVIIKKSIISFGIYFFYSAEHTTNPFGICLIPKQMGAFVKISKNYDSLKSRLEDMEKEGVKLYLNGVPSTTEYIIRNCVEEDTVYMPDYVTDRNGKIMEIRYDRVSLH